MSTIEDLLESTLKQSGNSLTRPRQLVFAALRAQEAQTMHELVKRVEPLADRASIYRTIALFETLGIVQRVQIGWKYKLELSDQFQPHHHHLTCSRCGRDEEISVESPLEKSITKFLREHDFSVDQHRVEIQGICRACATQN